MGDSPVRAFTVAAVISVVTAEDFAPRPEIEELIGHLLGRTVNLNTLHGADILKARRELVVQHGGLSRLKVQPKHPMEPESDHELYMQGFLDAAEALYGVPAEVTKHGGTGTYIFVRGLDMS